MIAELIDDLEGHSLDRVVTIEEAVFMWKKQRKTIQNRIDKNHVAWRRAGARSYLVSVASLTRIYGLPKSTLEDYYANA